MTAIVNKLTNEPIIITTISDRTTASALADAFLKNAEIATANEGRIYRVIDVRPAAETFGWSVTNWLEIARGVAGGAVRPELEAVFVGTPDMAPFFNNAQLLFFASMDQALNYARREVAGIAV